jgi:hypothetical protein
MSAFFRWRFVAVALLLSVSGGGAAAQATRAIHRTATSSAPIGRVRLPSVGVWADFEQLGANRALEPGNIIRELDEIDSYSGMRVSDEVGLQMDAMRSLGINIITFPLVTAATTYENPGFPQCNAGPGTGLFYPVPSTLEIANLGRFLDLAASKGLRVILRLSNNHEDDLTGSATWLDAIFPVARAHPNVDLISLDGDLHTIDTDGDGIPDACGGVSEPPLFRGFNSPQAQYIKWAIQRGMDAGIAPRLLSAEAITGTYIYFYQSPITLPGYQDGHAWDPVFVEKQIFDSLGIPDAQRTYDLSFYEMTRCGVLMGCVDESPAAWTEEVADRIVEIVGAGNGARVLAAADVMESHGFDGGAFWIWVAPSQDWQNDPTREQDVKKLGTAFVYNPVAKILEDMGGFHLIAIPNGSFENGGLTADHWFIEGSKRRRIAGPVRSSSLSPAVVERLDLSAETGEPDVPTRGRYALRLATGDPAAASVAAISEPIAVTPGTAYTTAMALRFSWSGDANVHADAASRPNVSVAFDYFDSSGNAIAARPADVFRYFQEDSTSGFAPFVFRYTPPDGAVTVRIEIAAHRNGLATPIVLDADAVR